MAVVAVIVLAIALAGMAGVVVALVYGRVAAADQIASARVAQVMTEAESERTHFELETTKGVLASVEARASALEEIIADEINSMPNADLGRTDVRNRLLRTAQAWRSADANRLPAQPNPALPDNGAPTGPVATDVPAHNESDVQQ